MLQYTEREVLPNNVFVFGCGGTGSRTIPPLIQLLKAQTWILNPNMYLIDGDVVEGKNCSRQHFIEQDVGKNKAQVIAERYSKGFGVDLKYYPAFFEGESDLSLKSDYANVFTGLHGHMGLSSTQSSDVNYFGKLARSNEFIKQQVLQYDLIKMFNFLTQSSGIGESAPLDLILTVARDMAEGRETSTSSMNARTMEMVRTASSLFFANCVIILCVDTAEARRKILTQMKALNPARKMFVIDAGNEDIYGQVSFFRSDHVAPFMDMESVYSFTQKVNTDNPSLLDGGRRRDSLHVTSNSVRMESHFGLSSRHTSIRGSEGFVPNSRGVNVRYEEGVISELAKEESNSKEGWLDNLNYLMNKVGQSSAVPLIPAAFPEMSSYSGETSILPIPDRFYDTLEDGEGTRSCADLDQTLAINNLMAAAIVNVVNNLVYSLPFTFNAIRISLNGGYSVDHMSHYWYKNMLMGNDTRYSNSLIKEVVNSINATRNGSDTEFKKHVLKQLGSSKYYTKAGRQRASSEIGYDIKESFNHLSAIANRMDPESDRNSALSDAEKSRLKEIGLYLSAFANVGNLCYTKEASVEGLQEAIDNLHSVVEDIEDVDHVFAFAVRGWFNNLFGNNYYNSVGMTSRARNVNVVLFELALCLRDDVETPVSAFASPIRVSDSFLSASKDVASNLLGYLSKGEVDVKSEEINKYLSAVRPGRAA